MADTISDIARRLACNAEAVCRHYLSNGRKHGRYWLVGDVDNTPGRSLYVRLWAASLFHGIIRAPAQHNVSTLRGIW